MFKKTPISYALRLVSTFMPIPKPVLFSGPGSTTKLAEFMIDSSYRRPLLVADSFLVQNGMLDGLLAYLKDQGCEVTVFDGIIPNPTFAVVEAGLKLSRDNNCDSVLVIGGGSAIDAAKVIAATHAAKKPPQKLAGNLKVKEAPLPFFVVPTTSGSGSEVTVAAVISDSETHQKQFVVSPKLIPIATALDPELLKTLPPAMTAAVGMDALTHAIEAYTSTNTFTDTDRDAATAVALLMRYLPTATHHGDDLAAREKVALASFLAGTAFTKAGLGYVHGISHQISAHYNTPHGVANAVILPRVLRFNLPKVTDRLAALERRIDPAATGSNAELAQRFVKRVDDLSDTLEIPAKLEDLQASDFAKITRDALAEARRSYAVPRVMKPADVTKILTSVAEGQRDIVFA
ncbi:iron-containing alcohol dehydrogenase [Thalassovita mediterranea]|uniref:Alcohol dehydrogenase 2 n=1 Tax=Thalassovita mediterranea TaxID=340021 RepID=A0A0P1GRC6_9RHOB|nr:iron-containing alcohol dehydrogenase [Thalassovita mediterranea]CUH84994.1 Alcohol dehydrogenase 2 [Thalassovita mediterranea]SIS35307.1 Alcohol dehydrogenase, class IV [Thalassovita mediterranea]